MSSLLGGFAGLGGGSIGRASIDLVLNAGTYDAQLAETEAKTKASTAGMQKGFSGFQSQVKSSFTGAQIAMVGFGALVAGVFVKAIGVTQEWAAEVRSLQRVTGQTAEQASALAGAGQQLGVSVDQMNIGFGLLSKNIVNSSANLTKYGIATKDATGNVLPFDDVLKAVSDKFATLPKGPEQAAFAMNVFGRSGKALIPILQQGSDGLATLEQGAKDAGLVLSQDDVDASLKLSIAQRQLGESIKGVAVSIGTQLVPVLTVFAKGLTDVIDFLNKVPGPIKALVGALLILKAVMLVTSKVFATDFVQGLVLAGAETETFTGAIGAATAALGAQLIAVAPLLVAVAGVVSVYERATGAVQTMNATLTGQVVSWLTNAAAAALAAKNNITFDEALKLVNGELDTTTHHLDQTGHAVKNFAGMTGSAIKSWTDSVHSSIQSTFETLGTKTKDIFDTTQAQLRNDANQMIASAIRFRADLTAVLSLKPGTLGLNKQDTQAFEQWLSVEAPGKLDAFLHANQSTQRLVVKAWELGVNGMENTYNRFVSHVNGTPVNIRFRLTSENLTGLPTTDLVKAIIQADILRNST